MNMILAIAVAVFMLHGTDAAEYTVGDNLGWTIPPGGAATYAAWAAAHSLVVNDILGELYFSFYYLFVLFLGVLLAWHGMACISLINLYGFVCALYSL